MGSKFTIALYAPDEQAANRAFEKAFARIAALDACLSDDSRSDCYSTFSQLGDLELAVAACRSEYCQTPCDALR